MSDIKVIDLRSNPGDSAFLIDDGVISILYDSGFGFLGNKLAKKIQSYLSVRKLDYIFLTHSHYDHALGSAYVLRMYPEAKVVAGRYAADIFKRSSAQRVMKELDMKCALACGVHDYEFLGNELRVDIPCDDGDLINVGDMTFQVINLPGHTRCSVGYYNAENKLLLACETLGIFDGKTVMPSFLIGYNETIWSIERVMKMDIQNILSPHYGLLNQEMTQLFLGQMEKATVDVANTIQEAVKNALSENEIIDAYKMKFWNGHFKDIYPEDALVLNTSIMIKLIRDM